ncbi:MAG: hypothetical protein HYY65_00075 [Candidatus Tectomicrobia bacterium]|uniref:Uncharacterized protein n=1 Tax=Tectimicrobiota bacterium TaxID=2528274 RepID=A0A932GM71_UNCTE|nr:hypothetical protein [Candidatus Tectomicrobia bacterium]
MEEKFEEIDPQELKDRLEAAENRIGDLEETVESLTRFAGIGMAAIEMLVQKKILNRKKLNKMVAQFEENLSKYYEEEFENLLAKEERNMLAELDEEEMHKA